MKNRILRSALSVALCAAMLLSQGLTAFADGEIDLAAAKSSPVQESSEESEAKTPTETLTPETKKELPASTEDETKTETTTGQPTAEDDTAKETTPIKPVDDEIAKRLEVTVICDNPFHTSQDATYTFYNDRYFTVSEVVGNDEEGAFFTVKINPQQYFDVYEKLCGTLYGEHHLVTKKVDPITFTWNNKEKTWDIKDAEVPVEIHVICEAELPSIPDSILEKIWVDMNCTEDDKHDTLKYTNLASVSPLDYSIEYNKDEGTATVSLLNLDEWVRLYDVQDKVKHTFTVSNPPTIGLKYNSENGWQLEDKSKNTFVIEIACDAFDKDNFISFIEQSVKVQIECVNENRLHNSETITWPLEEGSYSRGYWKIDDVVVNEQGGYTATITVDPSYCLDAYNKDNGEHYLDLHNSILSLAFNFNAASETWEPVEQHDFYLPVTCNVPAVPAVPTYKDLEELLGNMTVYCVNENHLVSKAYPITWNTIGGLNQKPVQNDDGTFSMEITVSYDPFKDLFDDEFGPHDYVENIELARSVVSLKWSKDVGTWIVDGSFINSFNVICDTPSTESLWGWNNGKEVIITCVEENALHTKGMTLSLVGVNGDKYWKFDPITWDQEQKCYTTTVTLEPGKYLEVYSGQYGEHALVSDHEDTVLSLKLSYQDGNGKWISNGDKFYLFVECNAPSKPTIEDLDRLFTNNTKVNISCEKNKHADKWYPVKDNSVDRLGYLFIGPVEVDDNNHYTAKISLNDAFFINLYNQEEGGDHSLVSKTYITLSYDGEKWVFNDESKLDFDVVVTCPDNDNPGGGEDPGTNPGGGDNGNNGGNNNGGSTGGGSSVSRRDDDDDWEPLPNNNYRVTKKNNKPSQNTQIVVRDPADNSDNTSSNTGSDSGKHNPETGDTTTVFAAMALAAVSLGGVVLLGRKKK